MKSDLDLSLYLVTSSEGLEIDAFLSMVHEAILGGVKIVQLREKQLRFVPFCELGKRLLNLLKPLRIPLVINDSVEVAHAIGADGVHVGQSDQTVEEARASLGEKIIIGLSVNTMEQVIEAQSQDVDYLAVSPLFSTNTKLDCTLPWGLEGLREVSAVSNHPVIAIGGIHEGNIAQVLEHGAQGVAVVSAIRNAPSPQAAAQAIRDRMRIYAKR